MRTAIRVTLLVSAALLGGFVTVTGSAVSRGLEPQDYSIRTFLYWLVIGSAVSLPLWLPALVPSRFVSFLTVLRYLSALALLGPAYLFGTVITHNLHRTISGLGGDGHAYFMGLTFTSLSLFGIGLLTWPEVKRFWAGKASSSS